MRNAATNRLITSGLCVLFRQSSAAGDERREESTCENPRPVQIVQVRIARLYFDSVIGSADLGTERRLRLNLPAHARLTFPMKPMTGTLPFAKNEGSRSGSIASSRRSLDRCDCSTGTALS